MLQLQSSKQESLGVEPSERVSGMDIRPPIPLFRCPPRERGRKILESGSRKYELFKCSFKMSGCCASAER